MQPYDVVIIGAGLAGLQCARLLGKLGVRVLLVDRKTTLTEPIHTTGIFVRRTLESFDLPQHCLGPAVRHIKLYSPRRRVLTLESPHEEFRLGHMGQLYLYYLQECEQVGVTFLPGCCYVACEAEEGEPSVKVYLKSGLRDHWVRTRYLVGADGARSQVARDLRLDSNSEWIVGVEQVLQGIPLQDVPCFHCFLDAELAPGYLGWLVHDGQEVHLGVGGYANRFTPAKALSAFRASLDQYLDVHRATFVEQRGGIIPVGGILSQIINEHGLLIGDASGAPSPLTAGGLDPCMRQSVVAVQVIVDYLSTGKMEVLAAYSGRQMRSHFISRQLMRRALAMVRSPQVLEGACALLRLPPLRMLAQHIFFGNNSFPDLR